MSKEVKDGVKTGNDVEKLLLSAGQVVDTWFGWYGTITLIDERLFKFGQGVDIIRHDDLACFSISPNDIRTD